MSQRKRTKKTSSGERRSSSRIYLSTVDKVLLGHGMLDTIEHVDCKFNWRGVGEIRTPFNREQVEINRRIYPHLFAGAR